jgi:hypothetical protein
MNRERLMFNPHSLQQNSLWFEILKEGKKRKSLEADGGMSSMFSLTFPNLILLYARGKK